MGIDGLVMPCFGLDLLTLSTYAHDPKTPDPTYILVHTTVLCLIEFMSLNISVVVLNRKKIDLTPKLLWCI